MSRKAKEVSSSGRGGGADTVVDVATVEFRFGAVVLIENWCSIKSTKQLAWPSTILLY